MNDDNLRPWYGRLTVWLERHVWPVVVTVLVFVLAAAILVAKAYREYILWSR